MKAGAEFAAKRGRIDAVVNNAMLLRYDPIEQVTDDVLERMLAIGVKGSVWGAQLLLAHSTRSAVARSSTWPRRSPSAGFPNTAVYSLIKGAIVTLTKTLAAELARGACA
jgi:3-oxoacyl-[acyl-carrier protein] reductase